MNNMYVEFEKQALQSLIHSHGVALERPCLAMYASSNNLGLLGAVSLQSAQWIALREPLYHTVRSASGD